MVYIKHINDPSLHFDNTNVTSIKYNDAVLVYEEYDDSISISISNIHFIYGNTKNRYYVCVLLFGEFKESIYYVHKTVIVKKPKGNCFDTNLQLFPKTMMYETDITWWNLIYTDWKKIFSSICYCQQNSLKRRGQLIQFLEKQHIHWCSKFIYIIKKYVKQLCPIIDDYETGINANKFYYKHKIIFTFHSLKKHNTIIVHSYIWEQKEDKYYKHVFINILKKHHLYIWFVDNTEPEMSCYLKHIPKPFHYYYNVIITTDENESYFERKVRLLMNPETNKMIMIFDSPVIFIVSSNCTTLMLKINGHIFYVYVHCVTEEFNDQSHYFVLIKIKRYIEFSDNINILHFQQCVQKIQRQWMKSYYCPDYLICKKIVTRSLDEIF